MLRCASKRTQMYLPEDIFEEIKFLAKREHKSIAAVIREAILVFLKKKESSNSWEKDSLMKIVGKGKSKEKDLSVNHDKYLYGDI